MPRVETAPKFPNVLSAHLGYERGTNTTYVRPGLIAAVSYRRDGEVHPLGETHKLVTVLHVVDHGMGYPMP